LTNERATAAPVPKPRAFREAMTDHCKGRARAQGGKQARSRAIGSGRAIFPRLGFRVAIEGFMIRARLTNRRCDRAVPPWVRYWTSGAAAIRRGRSGGGRREGTTEQTPRFPSASSCWWSRRAELLDRTPPPEGKREFPNGPTHSRSMRARRRGERGVVPHVAGVGRRAPRIEARPGRVDVGKMSFHPCEEGFEGRSQRMP